MDGIPNAPELKVNKNIGIIVYTFRWSKIPGGINWNLIDENLNLLDEKEFVVPIYKKKVPALSIVLESAEDSLDVSFENGRFTLQPSVTLVLRERLGSTWEDFHFLNATDQPDTKALEGIIPRGAKLAELFGVA